MFIVLPALIVLHVVICLLIVLAVLMQRPRSEGLGAAFGSGVTENIFGAQTTNVLAKFTTWLAGAFFVVTLLLSVITAKSHGGKTAIQQKLMEAPIPPPAPTPASTPTTGEPVTTPDASPVASPDASPVASPDASAVVTPDAKSSPSPAAEAVTSPVAPPAEE